MVTPSAAVTVTERVLSRATKLEAPETTALASALVGVALTPTDLVPLASVTVEPVAASTPFIESDFKLVSLEAGTLTVYL